VSGFALRGVSKRFGQTRVLDDIWLEAAVEEFVVVLGPSGCGKSTLLRVIAGLETIDAGEIEIAGARVDHLPPGKRGVAMVFQSYALYPHMTVRENMAFGLRNAGVSRREIERRVSEAAQMLEMEHLLERKPAAMSGGQRQRAAIGRAIVKEPKLFMFDEPLSNLDAALRNRTRQEIAGLHRRIRTAMIFVTHDQTEAMTLADRIVVMNKQKIEQIGTPFEIYADPATEFVATFVGSPAMNILPVRALSSGNGGRVALTDGVELDLAGLPARERTEEMHLGLRPESVTLCAPEVGDMKACVTRAEFLGDKTYLYLALKSGDRMIALGSASTTAKEGETIGVKFDRARAHLFDPAGHNLRRTV
jgi:multiple sugar transport system ATP-binding protein